MHRGTDLAPDTTGQIKTHGSLNCELRDQWKMLIYINCFIGTYALDTITNGNDDHAEV